ncbi:hypothetical protein TrST_g14084 [Triparma strigata]|uniref:Sfi1 spindle body domain-containing protein n=1 Tax=Triparma strigata TaxID=1606541 RepID=A0A9W6ZLN0_9STRA|nr:hypothetical protein TrST_g14084 [Triparma strigata]
MLPPDAIQSLVRQYNVALSYSDNRIRRRVLQAWSSESKKGPAAGKQKERRQRENLTVKTQQNGDWSGGQENFKPQQYPRMASRPSNVGQQQMNDIIMSIEQIKHRRRVTGLPSNSPSPSSNSALSLHPPRHSNSLMNEYNIRGIYIKYFNTWRSWSMHSNLLRMRAHLKQSSVPSRPPSPPLHLSPEALHLATLHCARQRKKRGIKALKTLLKSFSMPIHNYEGYAAPIQPGSQHRRIVPSGLLTLTIFKWMLQTLPPNMYPNKFKFSSYDDTSPRPSTDSFLRCKSMINPRILHSCKIKTEGGYTMLLHSKALLDVYNSSKIFKALKAYVRKIKKARKFERRNILKNTFGKWRVYFCIMGKQSKQKSKLTRILKLIAFKNLSRSYRSYRDLLLTISFSKLRKHADDEIAVSNEALSRAERFRFMWYAGRFYSIWKKEWLKGEVSRIKIATKHHNRKHFRRWLKATTLKYNLRAFDYNRTVRLMLKVINFWRYYIIRVKTLQKLTRRSTRARNLELKYFCLSRWYHGVMNAKVALSFRFKSLTRLVHKIFDAWKFKAANFRQFKLLMAYAERQSLKLNKRKFLSKLVENANKKKRIKVIAYRSNIYFGQKMFDRFKYAVEVSIWHRVQLEYHLREYTIKMKILPAWRRFVKIGKEVRKRGLEFNLFYYMEKWVQFVQAQMEERAEKLAEEMWARRKLSFWAFEEWARESKRRKRLKETERFLKRQTKRAKIARVIQQWNTKTNKMINARNAFSKVKRNRQMKILRGCVIVWRSSAFFKRAKRLKELNSTWSRFSAGLDLSRRSRENKNLADRLVYVKGLKGGLDRLYNNWKVSLYLKACASAADGACYKIRGQRAFKMLRLWVKRGNAKRDQQQQIELSLSFRRLRSSLKGARQARLLGVLSAHLKAWHRYVHDTNLIRSGKVDILMSSFDLMKLRRCFDRIGSLIRSKRAFIKSFWISWIKYCVSAKSKKEEFKKVVEKLDVIKQRSCLRSWSNSTKLKVHKKSGLSLQSNRTVASKALSRWAANVATGKLSKHVKEFVETRSSTLLRKTFSAWASYIRYVSIETSRLKKLRLSHSESEIRYRRKMKCLMSKAFEEWEKRVCKWIEKKVLAADADDLNEELRKKRGLNRFKVMGGKRRLKMRIENLNQFRELNLLRSTFEEILVQVQAAKKSKGVKRSKLIFLKLKHNVKNAQRVTRFTSNMQEKLRRNLMYQTFNAWKARYFSTVDKIQMVFDTVKKGWTTLAIKRLKNSPNLSGGIILLKACSKYEVRVNLSLGFNALKRNRLKRMGIDKLVGTVRRIVLNSTFERFNDHCVGANGLSSMARICMSRWKSGVRKIVVRNDLYIAKRVKRSYLRRWFRNLKQVKRTRERKSAVNLILEQKQLQNNMKLMESCFSMLVRYVSARYAKRNNYETADYSYLSFHFAKFIRRASQMGEARKAKMKARKWREEKLLTLAFYSFKVGAAGGRVAQEGAQEAKKGEEEKRKEEVEIDGGTTTTALKIEEL